MEIYLDNASTTKTDPIVLEAMLSFFDKDYGNTSSPHKMGERANEAIERARKIIADSIQASPEEIVFTSGGTESNNFAIKGVAFNKKRGQIITTKIEHKSVINTCKWLEEQDFEIIYLDVDEKGFVKGLEQAINNDTILVSVIHGHNETGTIQDLKSIKQICEKNNVLFHTDACQSYTKTDLSTDDADLISLNAHKIHGPKGVGALYVRKEVNLDVFMHGGGHEKGMRSGTINVPGIVGFAKAVEIADLGKMSFLNEKLKNGLNKIERTKIISYGLPHIVSAVFEGIEGEAVVSSLDLENIYAATGSACSSKNLQANQTLLAIGLNHQQANGMVRFSLSRFTTEQEIDKVLEVLPGIVQKLRKISPF